MYGVRRVAFNSMVLTLGSYFATSASLVTYLLAARALGPTIFGSLSGAIGIAVLVAGVGDFGVNGWAIRALARNPSSTESFKRTLTAKLTLATLLASAWVMISLATLGPSSLKLSIALLAGYVLSLVIAGTLTVPFRASENMTVVSVVAAVEKAVALGVSLAVQAHGSYQPETLPVALVAGGIASVVCAGVLIPRHLLTLAPPSFRTILELWRSSYSFGLVSASAQILRADVAIVGAVAGPYAAGVYAAPARLTTFMSVIPSSFSAAVFPRMVRASGSRTSRRPQLISAGAMLIVMVLLLGAFAVAAPRIVPLVLGSAYMSSVDVLRIYLVVILINAANQPLLAFLQAEGYEHYAGRAVAAAVIAGLLAIAAGARIGGASGAAVGALLLQLLQLLLFVHKSRTNPRPVMPTRVKAEVTDGGLELQWFPTDPVDDAAGP